MVIIQDETTKNPISLIGKEAGVCWNSKDTPDANYNRGLDCVKSNHGRTLEFPQIYMVLDSYSARVIREYYTHIGGDPSRLQSSTRFIKYGEFEYITPPSIAANEKYKEHYDWLMFQISEVYKDLEAWGCPKEDIANILPLGMTTKVVVRTNLRNLIDMSRQRMCSRAYWEYRQLFNDILIVLKDYSEEWRVLIDELKLFIPKCEELGYCPEKNGCGRKPRKDN